MILFKKFSFWTALLGIGAAVWVVYQTSYAEPIPDPTFPPSRKPGRTGIAASGIVESLNQDIHIGTPASGIITQVYVEIWDRVESGDPLFLLDDREAQSAVRAQEAEVRTQQAMLEDARLEYDRTEPLRGGGAVSDHEADAAKSKWTIQLAKLEAAKAKLNQLQTTLDRLTVRAPISGTILQVNARVGEHVTPGSEQAPVMLGAIDQFQIRAQVDEQLAPEVRPGAPATGYLKGETQNPIALEFRRIEPFIRPKRSLTGSSSERVDTRVLEILYTFDNPEDNSVYVGQQMDLFIAEP